PTEKDLNRPESAAGLSAKAKEAEPQVTPLAPAVPALSEDDIVKELPEIQTAQPEDRQEEEESRTPPAPRPSIPPMFIIQIAPELDPVAKVGGLADVVYGLSRELEIRGNSVEIILPKYDCMRYDHIWGLSRAFENL